MELIGPPVTIPIHYDDCTVFRSPLSDFLDEVRRRRLGGEIREGGSRGDCRLALPLHPLQMTDSSAASHPDQHSLPKGMTCEAGG